MRGRPATWIRQTSECFFDTHDILLQDGLSHGFLPGRKTVTASCFELPFKQTEAFFNDVHISCDCPGKVRPRTGFSSCTSELSNGLVLVLYKNRSKMKMI